jgi:drug/metabolite transporter (DMT)-like permease
MKKLLVFNVVFYSFLSGLLACFVSLCVKLAFNIELIVSSQYLNNSFNLFSLISLKNILKAAFICLSFLLNSLMWIFYSKGLHASSSTLYTTSLNKFSNFIFSAIFGYLLFEEKLNLTRWLFGLILLLIGILIINQEQQKQKEEKVNNNVQKELSARKKE